MLASNKSFEEYNAFNHLLSLATTLSLRDYEGHFAISAIDGNDRHCW